MTSGQTSHTAIPGQGRRAGYRRRFEMFVNGRQTSRGSRLLKRYGLDTCEQKINFSDLAAIPDWLMLEDSTVANVASVASLLHFRRQIDQTIDGEWLRALCMHVDEKYLDVACEVPMPSETMLAPIGSALPPPELMHDTGRQLIAKSLPPSMTTSHSEAANDPHMRELARLATKIVLMSNGEQTGELSL